MSVRNIILILVAVAITAGTGLVARSWISSQRPPPVAAAPPPPVKRMLVLVADKDLPAGTFIILTVGGLYVAFTLLRVN